MKYSIIYSSNTGNTALLAEQIRKKFGEEECECYLETCVLLGQNENEDKISDSDIVFVGFWTDKGTCDEKTKLFLNN